MATETLKSVAAPEQVLHLLWQHDPSLSCKAVLEFRCGFMHLDSDVGLCFTF